MENKNRRRIPSLLRKYRRVRGFKQKEVAMLLNLKSPSRISRWEKGACFPSVKNLFRLAIIYRVLVDAIFPDLYHSLKEELKKREDDLFGRKGPSKKAALD
ncbi:MAG TPA: helix-turn-helix transcriptional regulator [Candidatus Acidoferrales bacterium]|nr:helix-turn-helix transcriptional regulator [Candidatus Acidoferrales bacterium]